MAEGTQEGLERGVQAAGESSGAGGGGASGDDPRVLQIAASRAAAGLPFVFRLAVQVYDPKVGDKPGRNLAWAGQGFAVETRGVEQARRFLEVLRGVVEVMAAVEDPRMVLEMLVGEGEGAK